MNSVDKYNQKQRERLQDENKEIPENLAAGQTLKVHVRIQEGTNDRIQIFEGLCIAVRNNGIHTSIVVRKVASNGTGIERNFPIYSPMVAKIEIVKEGRVRRAKLYYIRKLSGKAAKIPEKTNYGKKQKKNNNNSN